MHGTRYKAINQEDLTLWFIIYSIIPILEKIIA
jgi:hypothetical protein